MEGSDEWKKVKTQAASTHEIVQFPSPAIPFFPAPSARCALTVERDQAAGTTPEYSVTVRCWEHIVPAAVATEICSVSSML